MSILHDGLVQLGFEKAEFNGIHTLPLEQLEQKMLTYIASLKEYNAKFDLINTDDDDDIAIRHILDSLSAVNNVTRLIAERMAHSNDIKDNFIMADIGSGAGLPGIPLSTALPNIKFILVERMTKRCAFLNHCKTELDLNNVTVEENQAERLEQERFDLTVFRAFRPLEKKMMHVLIRVLKHGGVIAAYKAKSDKIKEEMDALGKNAPVYTVEPLSVPFLDDHERNLVVIKRD